MTRKQSDRTKDSEHPSLEKKQRYYLRSPILALITQKKGHSLSDVKRTCVFFNTHTGVLFGFDEGFHL